MFLPKPSLCRPFVGLLHMQLFRRDEFRSMHGFSRDELAKMRDNFKKYAHGKQFIEGTLMGNMLAEVFPWAAGKSGQKMIAEIVKEVDDGDGKLYLFGVSEKSGFATIHFVA